MIVPILALAGSLVQKRVTPASAGTFPVHGGTFFILLIGTVLLIGALNFVPALALGPIVEHFLMQGGKTFLGSTIDENTISFIFDWNIVRPAIGDAFKKLDPRLMVKNPVMFVTMVGAALTTVGIFTATADLRGFVVATRDLALVHRAVRQFRRSDGRRPRQSAGGDPCAKHARHDGATLEKRPRGKSSRADLEKGDLVVCEAGDIIPADGEVIEGIASVDESAITGESAPVIRESGGDRSAVTGGTRVLSDRIVIRVTMEKGEHFLDRMIALVEGARRQKTPNEIALDILLVSLDVHLSACLRHAEAVRLFSRA